MFLFWRLSTVKILSQATVQTKKEAFHRTFAHHIFLQGKTPLGPIKISLFIVMIYLIENSPLHW